MSLKVNTHIVDATPEYIEPVATSNESETYKKSISDAYNSYLHPDEEVQNISSLKQRANVFEGFADENMPIISRSNVSGTDQNIDPVSESKSEALKKWVNDHTDKSYLRPVEEVQDGNKRTEVSEGSADENTPISKSNVSSTAKIENVVKSKL